MENLVNAIVIVVVAPVGLGLALLPGIALALLLLHRGPVPAWLLLTACLAGSGLIAHTVFFAYIADHLVGQAVSVVVLLASFAACLYWGVIRGRFGRLMCHAQVWQPLALMLVAALFYAAFGFVGSNPRHPDTSAEQRFGLNLPVDNVLPWLFARGAYTGDISKPLIGSWQSSDLPPLQTSFVLMQMPLWGKAESRFQMLLYLLTSVGLQTFWIGGLMALLAAERIPVRLQCLILASGLFSGFTLVHQFYAWPKLLATGYLLLMAAVLGRLLQGPLSGRLRWTAAGAAGICAALAVLSHGGAIFGLVGLGFTLLILSRGYVRRKSRRGVSSWGLPTTVVLSMFLVYTPWVLYQKLIDPPGTQAVKQLLTGRIPPSDALVGEGVMREFLRAYRDLSCEELWANKMGNIRSLFDSGDRPYPIGLFLKLTLAKPEAARSAAREIRTRTFHHAAWALGLLNLGFLAWLSRFLYGNHKNSTWRWAGAGLLWLVFTCVVWSLASFGPGTIHAGQGVFLIVILGFAALVAALWSISRRLALALVLLHIACQLLLFAPSASGGQWLLECLALGCCNRIVCGNLLRPCRQGAGGFGSRRTIP